MLHKTCRGYKNTEQICHTTLGNKSAKLLNCCRTSSASSLFCSGCLNGDGRAAGWHGWWHTAHLCWLQGNVGFTSVSLGKLLTTQLAQGAERALAHGVAKRTFQWLHSLKNFPSHHLINNDQRKAEPFFLEFHRLSWNESKTSKPTFSRSWNTDRC